MRLEFWASALVLLVIVSCAAAQGPAAVSGRNSISYSAEGSKSRIEIRTPDGARYIVRVERDSTVYPNVEPSNVTEVGEVTGSAVILIDTYPSIPGGLSYCQAGEGRFLRIISISKKGARETMRVKLGSCRDNIELGSRGIEWLPKSSTLHIDWRSGPTTKRKPEELTVRIEPGGNAVVSR
jgi:hypothetical protein